MSKSVEQSDVLGRLLSAIGKGDINCFERFALETELEEIKAFYSAHREQPTSASWNRLLGKFRKNTARRRELRKKLKPIRDDIILAGFLQSNPDADEIWLRALLKDPESTDGIVDPADVEDSEDRDIAFLIDSGGDFRKRLVRKLAIEPFLRFLEKHGITPSLKFPRNRMAEAWFEYLDIEKKQRPTAAGIRTIAREMKRANQGQPRRRKTKARARN